MTMICEAINRNNPDRALVGEVRGGEIVAASEIAESTIGRVLDYRPRRAA